MVPLLLLILLMVACQATSLEKAREIVSVGDAREDAIAALESGAWYYQPCENQHSIDDLFFYGSHDYDHAEVVIVSSALEEGKYRVYLISTLETNAWHTAYRPCIDRTRFSE
jgi:hypothetical protein